MTIKSVLSWNVGPNRWFLSLAIDLRQLIEPEDSVVSLSEMTPRNTALLRAAFPRWRVLRPRLFRKGDRRTDVVVMIRRRLPMPKVTAYSHDVRWLGPKEGIWHTGRGHVGLDWAGDRLFLLHRVPGGPTGGVRTGGKNLEAWKADLELIATASASPGRIAIIGDQNATAPELGPEYQSLGLNVRASQTKVDHAAERGYPKMRSMRLEQLGSDHPAVRWTLR